MKQRLGMLAAGLAAMALGLIIAASPATVSAMSYWRLTLSPSALEVGVPTNVTATVTQGTDPIGCVVITVPAGFTVSGVTITSVPSGLHWTATTSGSGPTSVVVAGHAMSDRLVSGRAIAYVVRVTANTSSLPAWTAVAYMGLTPGVDPIPGSANSRPGAFSIDDPSTPKPKPTATPTPTPMPTPTPAPTRTPTPTPTAAPTTAPTARPTASASSSRTSTPAGAPGQPTPAPTPSPTPTATPTPTPTSSASPTSAATANPPSQMVAGATSAGSESGDGQTQLDIRALPAGGSVSIELQNAAGAGIYAWAVPVLFLGLPGLLLVLVVLGQACFAWLFVPVTSRVLGINSRRRTPAIRRGR